MGKLKKPPKNPFFFFIMEMKKQREAQGYRVGNFNDAMNEFSPVWASLSKEDRAPYDLMAKNSKEEEKYNVNNKFTVTGESYAQVHRKQLDQQTAQEIQQTFIERQTSGPEAGDRMYILAKVLYSVEEIIDKKRKVYWPSEIALIAFSLKGGIKAIYTQMVDTVVTPTGYASQAKDLCEETLMPLPGDTSVFTRECRNYLQILKNINGFANHWLKGYDVPGHRKVFFALDKEMLPITTSFQWMVNQLDGKDKPKYQKFVNKLKVYSLAKLVLAMAEDCNRVNPKYINYLVQFKLDTAAEDVITKGNYDYREEIACPHHRIAASMKIDKCAQSTVMRRVYMLFEEFVTHKGYGFPMLDRHKIDGLSGRKMHGPIVKKKREESPKEVKKVSEPAWMKVDEEVEWLSGTSPKDTESSDKTKSKQEGSKAASSWGHRTAPTTAFGDDDFPTLGSAPAGSSSKSSAPQKSAGWMEASPVRSVSPALSAVSSSSGGSNQTPAWTRNPARTARNPSPPVIGFGRGRGSGGMTTTSNTGNTTTTSRSFMDDDDDDDDGDGFPTLQASFMGRGRGGR